MSEQRKQSMACVALPTRPLAMAEAERMLPAFVTDIEGLLAKHGLADDAIIFRSPAALTAAAAPCWRRWGWWAKRRDATTCTWGQPRGDPHPAPASGEHHGAADPGGARHP